MKIQHLQYALEIADLGSINKAADRLLLSQPNISSALKSLENELGFPIFFRTNKGIAVTPDGQQLLASARKIVAEYEQITSIHLCQKAHRLHLSTGYHSAIEEAFALLCAEYQDSEKLNFTIINVDSEAVVENVHSNKSDLGILLLPHNAPSTLQSLCQRKNLTVTPIRELCYYVNLREGHPLLQESPFDLRKLYDYPFVDYYMKILSSSADFIAAGIIDPDKRIFVDERDTRCHLVSISNAFSVGCKLHPRIQERYRWISIPIPEISFQMVSVRQPDSVLGCEAKRYLSILKREIERIADPNSPFA